VRARGTLILLALCLAVGAYLWFVERGKPTGEEKAAADRQVLAIPPASARQFRLDYGDSVVVLNRNGSEWRGTIVLGRVADQAPSFLAEEMAVENLTGFFAALPADRLLPAAEIDSAATGLDHPWVRVTIEAAADSAAGKRSGSAPTGGRHQLAFGYQNPTRTAYYTQIDDRKDVALISASAIESMFRRPLSDFRDRHLARFDSDQVARVDLSSAQGTLALEKVDDRWWIDEPHYLADESQVRGLLSRLRDLQATELATGQTAARLDRPALEIAVRSRAESTLAALTIGPEIQTGSESLHLVRSSAQPALASIRAEDFSGLTLTVPELRDHHLLALGGAAIDSLTITFGGRRFQAATADSAFAAVATDLPEWRATSFASESAQGPALAAYGLAPPRFQVQAKVRNAGVREVYLGNAEPSGGVFAARPGEPGVMVAPAAVVEALEQAIAKAETASGKKAPPPPGSR